MKNLLIVLVMAVMPGVCSAQECLQPTHPIDKTEKKLYEDNALKTFLQTNPEYKVARFADVAKHGEFSIGCLNSKEQVLQHKRFLEDSFRPIASRDTNRDGLADLVVVLVRRGKFSVVVLQARPDGDSSLPVWLVKDDPEMIVGINIAENGSIVPYECMGCHASRVFVWTEDDAYQLGVHNIGDHVCVHGNTELHPTPSLATKGHSSIRGKKAAQIVAVGRKNDGQEVFRWYQVRLAKPDSRTGYIRGDKASDEPGLCD